MNIFYNNITKYNYSCGEKKFDLTINKSSNINYIQKNTDNIIKEIYKEKIINNNVDIEILFKILVHPYTDTNLILEILKDYPKLNSIDIWNSCIINNYSISFDFILLQFIKNNYNLLKLNFSSLSLIIELKYIDLYPDYQWCFSNLSLNPYLTLDFIKKYKDKNWSWYYLSYNEFITFEIVEFFIDKDWDWYGLSNNKNLTFKIVEKYYCKKLRWNWKSISMNKNMTIEIIEKYNNYPWDYYGLSLNPNINLKYIMQNINLNWSWNYLSMNNSILNEEILINNLNLNWNWSNICSCIKLSAKFIKQNINKFPLWNWREYSNNIYFDFECIDLFPDSNFNWYAISHNPNINLEIYNKYKTKFILNELIDNIYGFHTFVFDKKIKEYKIKKIEKIDKIFMNYSNISKDLLNELISYIDFSEMI